MATTGEGEASGGSVATTGGGDDGGDDSVGPTKERGKRKKSKSRDVRRANAAKGR